MKTYTIRANFCGYFGAEQTYTVDAMDEDDAREQVREMVLDDLSLEIEDVEEEDE